MGPRAVIGILLIVLGVVGLLYGSVTYTHDKKVVDLGPIEVTKTERERVPFPPLVGGLFVASGVVLLAFGGRR